MARERELYYMPVLQIANQDSEMIYYGYGMIAKLFVLSPNMKGQMKGVEKVFFENWSVEWHFNFSECISVTSVIEFYRRESTGTWFLQKDQ